MTAASAVMVGALTSGSRAIKNTLQATVDRRIKPMSTPATAHSTSIDDLLMLAELHDRGVLTDEEFASKKKQVLAI
jgi:hypothetical protein